MPTEAVDDLRERPIEGADDDAQVDRPQRPLMWIRQPVVRNPLTQAPTGTSVNSTKDGHADIDVRCDVCVGSGGWYARFGRAGRSVIRTADCIAGAVAGHRARRERECRR